MNMVYKVLCLFALVLTGCKQNHSHDGLYIANKQVTGVTKAWILEGDNLTIYNAGLGDVVSIDQYDDRIVLPDDEIYYFNTKGEIVIPMKGSSNAELLMVKVSPRTKYNFGELDKLIDDAIVPQFRQ